MGFPQPAPTGANPFTADGVKIGTVGPSSKAGMTMDTDTNIYRSSANVLATDDFLSVGDGINVTNQVRARVGAASQTSIGGVGPGGEAAVTFGSAEDTNLYRSAADTLKTDDKFQAPRVLIGDGTVGAPSLALATDDDASGTGFYRSAANAIGWAINGVQKGAFESGKMAVDSVGDMTGALNLSQGGITKLQVLNSGVVVTSGAPLKMSNGTYAGGSDVGPFISGGTGAPNNANGVNGDIYLRVDGGALTTIYQRRAGVWVGII